MEIRNRLFALVDEKYKEQKDFASEIGVIPQVVSAWRNGTSKSYTKYLPAITAALGTSAEYLLTGKVQQSDPEETEQTAAPEGNGLSEEFARLFAGLAPEDQTAVIADMLRRGRAKGK